MLAAVSMKTKHIVDNTLVLLNRFRIPPANGSRKNGRDKATVVDTGIVSVKTMVTEYVPGGVVADVLIVTVFADAEYVQVAPAGRFRHVADTFVALEGNWTV